MPCGGIYPKEGSWAQHANAALGCYHCDLPCCELWVEEWDAPIHDRCVEEFLKTPDGQVILDHGHEVVRLTQRRPGKTTYVHCRLCGKVHEKPLPEELFQLILEEYRPVWYGLAGIASEQELFDRLHQHVLLKE